MPFTRSALRSLLIAIAIAWMAISPAAAQDAGNATEIRISQISVPNGEIVSVSPDGRWLLAEHPLPPEGGDVGVIRAFQSDTDQDVDEPDPDEPKLCVYAF